ncbi:MAG TPA: TIGR02221 family CRISPR-associated protein [Blastocatellia bacterium]|nr:TIGR02221 family CRISPR-associated protein [Blastocatellia bacterium]
MKLLSLLGTGNYQPVTYAWGDHLYKTDLFPEALANWLNPSQMLVLLTAEAKRHKHWENLQSRLSGKVNLIAVDIPSGKSESELWEIFASLTGSLDENEEVVFDVTHAFRSLPILALLAAAYLRVARAIKLQSMLYGAYEAKDENNRAPVFDLTPFIKLLDWVTATDKFVKTGDARELAELLKEAHRIQWVAKSRDERQNLPYQLNKLGSTLADLSQALLLTRPYEVAAHATALAQKLDAAAAETSRWAKPFEVLLKRTQVAYAPFAASSLAVQRNLVWWYIERQHFVQALTLAREWLVSWVCIHLGKEEVRNRSVRDEVERAINQAAALKRGLLIEEDDPLLLRLNAMAEFDALIKTWSKISDLRNDVAHCGMRTQARPVNAIVNAVREVAESLNQLPLPDRESE